MLRKGLHWRVGDGRNIIVVTTAWILGNRNDLISKPISNTELRVSEFINRESRTWKIDLLCATFGDNDARKILQIPLARAKHEDLLVWRGEATGALSIRSDYKFLIEADNEDTNNNLQFNTKLFYRKLWTLEINAKQKIFMWRISWGFLPTFVNLRRRRLGV